MVKRFAYLVTKSTVSTVKVGSILLYKQSRGPNHSEQVFNTKTFKDAGYFAMEQIGPCWIVGGKVQFEKPPQLSGMFTESLMKAARKRGRELLAASRKGKQRTAKS